MHFQEKTTSGLASAESFAKSAFLIVTINFLFLSIATFTPVLIPHEFLLL